MPELSLVQYPVYRKLLDLIGRLTPIEDPFAQTFRIFYANARALADSDGDTRAAVELIGIIRILVERGYLASKGDTVDLIEHITSNCEDYTHDLITEVSANYVQLVGVVNNALHASSW
jgi:hypothetical protein